MLETNASFADALQLLYRLEGDPSKTRPATLPHDKGGLTWGGMTQATWTTYIQENYNHNLPISLEHVSPGQLADAFHDLFWRPCNCAELPWPASSVLFQAAVNIGPRAAVACLQAAVFARPIDGLFGVETLRCVKEHAIRSLDLADRMLVAQSSFYSWHPNFYTAALLDRVHRVRAWILDTVSSRVA